MRTTEVITLFDYNYWANRQILAAADELGSGRFTVSSDLTWRDLRGTLVHTLDVERSWRGRLRGDKRETWDVALVDEDYPTAAALASHWERDEVEMRAWLGNFDDEALAGVADLGEKDRFPLWYFLVHILTHSAQQRRDAALLLTHAGHAPAELEFLNYADWLRDREK